MFSNEAKMFSCSNVDCKLDFVSDSNQLQCPKLCLAFTTRSMAIHFHSTDQSLCSCNSVQAIRSKWRFITMTSACFRYASTSDWSLTQFSQSIRFRNHLSSMKFLVSASSSFTEIRLGSKGKLQFPFMWSAWLQNEAHFRAGFPCNAHGWAHSWQHQI